MHRPIVGKWHITIAINFEHDGPAVVGKKMSPRGGHDSPLHDESKMFNVPPCHFQRVFNVQREMFNLHQRSFLLPRRLSEAVSFSGELLSKKVFAQEFEAAPVDILDDPGIATSQTVLAIGNRQHQMFDRVLFKLLGHHD